MKKQDETANTFTKKIGRTTYKVRVYFNPNSKESFNDKLLRIIKNDIASGALKKQVEL